MVYLLRKIFISLILLIISLNQSAFATPALLTYQGRIVKSDGVPLEYNSVSFIFQITSPSGSCVIFEEQLNGYNMVHSKGLFDTPIGSGSRSFPASGTFTVLDSLRNDGPLSCKGGLSYTPASDDGRKLRVQFFDGYGWSTIFPDNIIRTVPYAGYAASAATLGKHDADSFLLKTGIPSCVSGTVLSWNGTALGCAALPPSGGGPESDPTVAAFSKNTPSADFSTPGNVLTLNTVPIAKGGTGATTAVGGLNALLPSQGGHAGKILKTDGTNASWDNIPASGVTSVDVAVPSYMSTSGGPITSSGVVTLGFDSQVQNLIFASPVSGAGAPSFRSLQINDIASSAGGTFLTGAACTAGQALVYTAANDTISCQAITVTASGAAGGDLTGNYPAPTIATGAVSNGKLAADAVTTDKILDGTIATNDLANAAVTDAKIANVAVSKVASGVGHYFTYAPDNLACTPGQILKWQNSRWECGNESGVGSETDPTVAAFSKNAPSADFSTPANVLTLNTIPISKGGTGATTQSAAINALLPTQGSNAGKVLQTNGSSVTWETIAAPDLSGYVAKTGDTMSGALNLPSNGLAVGTDQLVVSGGYVGVGTDSPSHPVHIRGNTNQLKGLFIENSSSGASAGPMFEMMNDNGTRGVMFVGSSNHPAPYTNRLTFENIDGGASGISFMSSSATGDIRWFAGGDSAGDERMRILPSGNIGIGVTNPSEKLEVGGKVKATEFCIGGTCLTSWPSAGGSGTVTQVSTGTGLTGGPINTTGIISIASGGVSATELASNAVTTVKILDNNVTPAKLETVSGLVANTYGTATKVPSITVDTKGRVTAIAENNIAGLLPAVDNGKFLKSDNASWAPANITFGDIKNGTGTSAFDLTGCAANQTVSWSSLTDMFRCQTIGSLDADKITTGTIDSARLPASVKVWQDGGSNKIYYNLGNVGIGTTNPSNPLHIVSTTDITNFMVEAQGVSGNSAFELLAPLSTGVSDGKAFSIRATSEGLARAMFYTDGKIGLGSGSATRDTFISRSGTSTLRLSSDGGSGSANLVVNGNVGIGTNNPSTKLHVLGGAATLENNANDPWSSSITFKKSTNNGLTVNGSELGYIGFYGHDGAVSRRGASIMANVDGTSGASDLPTRLSFFTTADNDNDVTERMRITNSGNVGIGTTNPLTRLHVAGPVDGDLIIESLSNTGGQAGFSLLSKTSGGSTMYTNIYADWDGNYVIKSASGAYDFRSADNSATHVAITSAGNMAVGNIYPNEKLEVAGNIKSSGQLITGSQVIAGGTTAINWNNGNVIRTDYDCASAFNFANLQDGGTYTLIVTGTGTTQCNFSTTTTGTGNGTVTYRYKPANAVRSASSYTVYTLMRTGSVVLVSWGTGF